MTTNSQQEEHHPEQQRICYYCNCEVHPSTYRKRLALTLPLLKRTIQKNSNYAFLPLLKSSACAHELILSFHHTRMQIYNWKLFGKNTLVLQAISFSQIEIECHIDMFLRVGRKCSSNSKAIQKMLDGLDVVIFGLFVRQGSQIRPSCVPIWQHGHLCQLIPSSNIH